MRGRSKYGSAPASTSLLSRSGKMSSHRSAPCPYLQMQADGIALADNVGLNVHMLRASGIPAEHIFISEQDTCAGGEAFFSYRRDRCKGRHFSFLYKK